MKKYEIPIHVFGIVWVLCYFWLFFIAPSFGEYITKISAIIFIILTVLVFISVVYAGKKEKISIEKKQIKGQINGKKENKESN